jgi:hypothetical protein
VRDVLRKPCFPKYPSRLTTKLHNGELEDDVRAGIVSRTMCTIDLRLVSQCKHIEKVNTGEVGEGGPGKLPGFPLCRKRNLVLSSSVL